MPIETLNYILALGTLGMQVLSVAFFALYFLQNRFTDLKDIGVFLSRRGLWLGLLLALGSCVMTLYYSEVLGFEPCPLCWWQRVFLYPQVIIFALALWKRDSSVWLLSTVLSVLGLVVALYHHALQMFPGGSLPCPAVGVSCAKITILEFGYVTFPLMAATLFVFLIVLMLFVKEPAPPRAA